MTTLLGRPAGQVLAACASLLAPAVAAMRLRITDARGNPTRYVYDAERHLRFVLDPQGGVTEFRYDAAGRQVSAIQYPQHPYSRLLKASVLSAADAGQGKLEPALDLILISRHLERIGDHATNIAEDVIYYVEGRDVRHSAETKSW